MKAYVEGADDPNAELDDRERRLPQVAEGDALSAEEISVDGHATKPPARYTEASLVKELEEREIGRPSTYASIIGTILDRGYVFKKGTALVPVLPELRRGQPAGEALRPARRLRLHRQDGGRPRPHRAGRGAGRAVAEALLLRRGRRRGRRVRRGQRRRGPPRRPQGAGHRPRRDRRPGDLLASRSATASCCASAATARTSSAARRTRRATSARTSRRTSRPTS